PDLRRAVAGLVLAEWGASDLLARISHTEGFMASRYVVERWEDLRHLAENRAGAFLTLVPKELFEE
ncbi:hypothetical protein BaRGS_00007602, partial [Batillaria attramentaria]